MATARVASLAELTPGTLLEATVGDRPIALCNFQGAIHAFTGECPHLGGPLGQGTLDGNTIICPWHGWEFNCVTGENLDNPEIHLDQFAVQTRDNDVLVDIA
jgi:nitrite reductase (NADH) small subunit